MFRAFFVMIALLSALLAGLADAQTGTADRATLARASLGVGEQAALRIEVHTASGQTVEVNPGGASWNGVELVRITATRSRPEGDRMIHTIDAVVASFTPGGAQFQPAVTIISGAETEPRLLPALALKVVPGLGPDDPLEISPLASTAAIGGAESPFLKPALVLGAAAVLSLAVALLHLAVRRFRGRRPAPAEDTGPALVPPTLEGAEQAIAADPVAAYRTLSSVVRGVLGERYGFPAPSLTTQELKKRMEAEGVDRWQARLVGGLLEECDAVVYAGYRPAGERRLADLTMAREIVEAVA